MLIRTGVKISEDDETDCVVVANGVAVYPSTQLTASKQGFCCRFKCRVT